MLNALIAYALRLMPRWAWIMGALALVAILITLAIHRHNQGVIARYRAGVEAKSVEARDTAADERARDAAALSRDERDLHDAIDDAPAGGTISPAAHALSCQRLRQHGRIPPACRSGSGDGIETHSN